MFFIHLFNWTHLAFSFFRPCHPLLPTAIVFLSNNVFQPFYTYSVFRRFRQVKFAYGGSILSLSHFLLLLQPPLITTLSIKVVKIDSKIIISLPWFKSMKQTVCSGLPRNHFFPYSIMLPLIVLKWVDGPENSFSFISFFSEFHFDSICCSKTKIKSEKNSFTET